MILFDYLFVFTVALWQTYTILATHCGPNTVQHDQCSHGL